MKKFFALLLVMLLAFPCVSLADKLDDAPLKYRQTCAIKVTVKPAENSTVSGSAVYRKAYSNTVVLVPSAKNWEITVYDVTSTGFRFTATYLGSKTKSSVKLKFKIYTPRLP